jgi:hypothetical protein
MTGKVDKLLGEYRESDISLDSSAPSFKSNGYVSLVGDTLWFFSGDHRYKLTATLDDPVIETLGSPYGLLLTLTQPA